MTLLLNRMTLKTDFSAGHVDSLMIAGKERITSKIPLFRIGLRGSDGLLTQTDAYGAKECTLTENGAIYSGFEEFDGLTVCVSLENSDGEADWRISVDPGCRGKLIEWVEFPLVNLPLPKENSPEGGSILFPYNEGALVDDINLRENTSFRHRKPEYPSEGLFAVFPNMVCSQMLGYIWDDCGLYIGAHDAKRGVKGIDFFRENDGVTMQLRLYCGTDFGEEYRQDYPVIWSSVDGRWEAAAERYRQWFESALPPRCKKISENENLPAWYEDSPLIVSYPVRGIHDMDKMDPNRLFPYTNALPLIDEIREASGSRIMVLLMHWEGTAPWAPPYVWPPYGGEDNFRQFMDALHEKGDLLGLYCSGFGYTIQSNLIDEYNCQAEYDRRGLEAGMCAGPDNKVHISRICTGQRSGYDICPASDVGREILLEAYKPLFESGIDYAQILDQNHGGGQYFCYSRDHGHPPAPGTWMTENMQNMLSEWNAMAGNTLFGCESAAAEPFVGNLLFSDNRFELNYCVGKAVPMYAYIYHEYLRNFMGNQVACPFRSDVDSLRWRMAYSFAAGDCMTLVLTPDGILMPNWGTRDFAHAPNREKTLEMIKNLTKFYRDEAKPYLMNGRMIPAEDIECACVEFEIKGRKRTFPALHTSAWESEDGERAQIIVNPGDRDEVCRLGGQEITVGALDAVMVKLS